MQRPRWLKWGALLLVLLVTLAAADDMDHDHSNNPDHVHHEEAPLAAHEQQQQQHEEEVVIQKTPHVEETVVESSSIPDPPPAAVLAPPTADPTFTSKTTKAFVHDFVATIQKKATCVSDSIQSGLKRCQNMTKEELTKTAVAAVGLWGVSVAIGWLAESTKQPAPVAPMGRKK
jgi:hypothetical protein